MCLLLQMEPIPIQLFKECFQVRILNINRHTLCFLKQVPYSNKVQSWH